MIFERPDLLAWAPVAILLLAAGIARQWRRSARLTRAFGGPTAARRLTGRWIHRFPAARLSCASFAALAIVLAATGVHRDAGESPAPPAPVDLIIALDVSHSMSAGDVDPSRADRARQVVRRILEERVADRVALTLFAGWPYGLVPVTDDERIVEFFLPPIDPELVPQRDQGTSLAAVVGHAAETWRARAQPDAVAVVLVISDGEAHGSGPAVLDSIDAATADGLRIWTAGVGTEEGAPLFVPRSGGAPLLEGAGAQVVAGYDPDLLSEMARRGGGVFHDVGDDGGQRALLADLRDLGGGQEEGEDRAPFDPTTLLLLMGLALLGTEAILDSGVGSRARARGAEWT